jgi:hypothetical protein
VAFLDANFTVRVEANFAPMYAFYSKDLRAPNSDMRKTYIRPICTNLI